MKKEIGIAMILGLVLLCGVASAETWDCKATWDHTGDVNGDGNVNVADCTYLYNWLDGGMVGTIYDDPDINYDGYYNIADCQKLYAQDLYPGWDGTSRCYKAQLYRNMLLNTNYKVHQYVKYCDYTDENEYIPEVYDCHDFVIDVVERLRTKNVPAHHIYYRYPDGIGAHGLVLIDFAGEYPMIIEAQNDEDETDYYDVDQDGIVEYTPEVNYVNDQTPYYYLIYNPNGLIYPAVRMNTDWAWWATDDGNLLADMNYQ